MKLHHIIPALLDDLHNLVQGCVASIQRRRRKYLAALAILYVAILTILLVPLVLDPFLRGDGGPRLKYWLQLLAGNWSAGPDTDTLIKNGVISDREFATSVVAAVLINNLLIFILGGLIWRLIVERNKIMEATDALILESALTREALRNSLVSSFKEIVSRGIGVFLGKSDENLDKRIGENVDRLVNSAYEQGRNELILTLEDVVEDKEQLAKILALMEKRSKVKQAYKATI